MRDVWTDTENDDVSDSGIQSLPTSEDTGSDTDISIHDIKMVRCQRYHVHMHPRRILRLITLSVKQSPWESSSFIN
jgi:hypothetical protein